MSTYALAVCREWLANAGRTDAHDDIGSVDWERRMDGMDGAGEVVEDVEATDWEALTAEVAGRAVCGVGLFSISFLSLLA